jgi:transposase-like protein
MTPEQFETMFRGLKKAVLERALRAELTHHLRGYAGSETTFGRRRFHIGHDASWLPSLQPRI